MAKVVKSTREMVDVDQELEKLETKKSKKTKNTEIEKKAKKDSSKSKKTDKKKTTKKKKGLFNFFHEVRKEVEKVKWPSKKEMIKYSVATIIFVIFFASFFYLIELVLALLKMGV